MEQEEGEVLDAYTSVMGNPGVFGEKIEIIALSKTLKRPISLFYYHGVCVCVCVCVCV